MPSLNGNFRNYALIASGVVAVAAIGAAVYRPDEAATIFGFALTIITILLAAAGLAAGQVQLAGSVSEVHDKVDGITSRLVDTTASSSFQAGQAAGVGAPVPPAPSSLVPAPGQGAVGQQGPTGPAGPQGPQGPPGGGNP